MLIDTTSFKLSGKDCKDFNIQVSQIDVITPPRRQRKTSIPLKDGMYDFGTRNYEERILQIKCLWHSPKQSGAVPRSLLREVAYWLKGKQRIILSSDPNICYIGELFESPDLINTYLAYGMIFDLVFICEPFAYDLEATQAPIKQGRNSIAYMGTAETPPLITLYNNTNQTINKIKIITTKMEGK